MGGGGTGSSKRPLFDLNLSPPPEEEANSLEEERRRLVDSKEYKKAERHNLKLAERIKGIRQRAKEIAQERGLRPDDVDSAADYVASGVDELPQNKQLGFLSKLRKSLETPSGFAWPFITEEMRRWRPGED